MISPEDPKDSEIEIPEADRLLSTETAETTEHILPRHHRYPRGWILICALLTILCIALTIQNIQLRGVAKCPSTFSTDLLAAKRASELVEYRFTGGIQVDNQGKLYREMDSTEPQYVGNPTAEIDRAWDDLLSLDIVLDETDAYGVERSSIHTVDGRGIKLRYPWELNAPIFTLLIRASSLDVYHSLHCVNEVRMAVDFQYYYPTGKVPYFYRTHLDHCLDYLRQVVQCQSDLTPLTYEHYEPKNTSIPVFGTPHTCRNFTKVHEWAKKRSALEWLKDKNS